MKFQDQTDFCQLPTPPPFGKYTCDISNDISKDENFQSGIQPGTVCRAVCNRLHTIPYHLRSLGVIQCYKGSWNATRIELCYRQRHQRHSLRTNSNLVNHELSRLPQLSKIGYQASRVRITYD